MMAAVEGAASITSAEVADGAGEELLGGDY